MPLSFICPHCRTLLKVRDESFIGTTLDCPDCHKPLQIAVSATGEVSGQEIPVEQPSPSAKAHKSGQPGNLIGKKFESPPEPTADSTLPPLEQFPSLATGSRVPQIAAWTVAGICLFALIPFLLPTSKPANPIPDTPKVGKDPVVKKKEPPASEKPVTKKAEPPKLPDTPAGRLEELGKLVLEQAKVEGHFPPGTVPAADLAPDKRWSWQAQLAARHDNPNALHVAWNQRWNEPSQDPFVRRAVSRFQNPAVELKAGEDKYPASHFVGVAGVGTDAPTLPADHPRAGIFGQDRQTKLDQIRDGASNTMLLAGVEEHLGSWAAGTSSYRSFTREPYVRGPDGFGTGDPDSMLVLMADGSVRTIGKQTDPRIVRRMAAMSDGFPLDPGIPGEPGDTRPGTVPVPNPMTTAVKPPDKAVSPMKNVVAPVAKPAEKVIDIPAALSRKVLKFDQSKPAAAFQLLLQIEELAGVRIEYDRQKLGPEANRLDKLITLKKQNASLEELLDDVLKQIDLGRHYDKDCIRIVTQ